MRTLLLNNFKAFNNEFTLETEGRNVLIYGENGAGKTSLFEGIKLFYFKKRLLIERVAPNVVGQARTYEERLVLDEFKNDDNAGVEVKVDEESFYTHLASDDESVFLVSYLNITKSDTICIEDLINDAYFSKIDSHSHWLSQDFIDLIVDSVNMDLTNFFWMEDVKIHSTNDKGECSIKNFQNKIPKSKELHKFFNESIIHVVKFIILIELIGYFHKKKSLLVLDDCFNSLDMPNRTFLMKFLLNKTSGIQKIVLTHNIGFYNLFSYVINNTVVEKEWKFYNLVIFEGKRMMLDGSEKTTNDIKKEIKNLPAATVGNELRRRFEILIYRLSHLNNIGELQETKDLLDKMCTPNAHIHLSIKGDVVKDIYSLVDEIYANVTNQYSVNSNVIV